MARSGRSFPSKSFYNRLQVQSGPPTFAPDTANISSLSNDAKNLDPSATAGYASIAISSISKPINLSFNLSTININNKVKKTTPIIKELTDVSGTKFILRDVARLPFNTDANGYVLRFRLISHDRNRSSEWSPFYVAKVPSDKIPTTKLQTLFPVATSNRRTRDNNNFIYEMTWEPIKGVDYLDIYEQSKPVSAGLYNWNTDPNSNVDTQWTYLGRQSCTDQTNYIRVVKVDQSTPLYQWRWSFHRPQIDPYFGATSTTSVILEEQIYSSRIFFIDRLSF